MNKNRIEQGEDMKKRIMSLVIALLLLLGAAVPETVLLAEPVQAAETTYTYSPQKAVAYADKYWSTYNDFYPSILQ